MTFPLESWFDITKRIPKADVHRMEVQMMLYAVKDGIDPDCAEAKRQYGEMRKAVKEHNKKFPPPEQPRRKASKMRRDEREKEKC